MMQRRAKYNAKPIEIDRIRFDSIAEGNRYLQLKALLQNGEISDLKLQPEFLLQEPFTDNKGKRHRAILYRADFQYTENGKTVVEDVKGMETQVYKIKKKMFLYVNKNIDFRETK